jgi:hypothetical protein
VRERERERESEELFLEETDGVKFELFISPIALKINVNLQTSVCFYSTKFTGSVMVMCEKQT